MEVGVINVAVFVEVKVEVEFLSMLKLTELLELRLMSVYAYMWL